MSSKSGSERHKIVYPTGADLEMLKRLREKALAERQRQFAAEHEAFVKEAKLHSQIFDPLVKSLGLKREELEKSFKENRKNMHELLRKAKPSQFEHLRTHNPVRWAPYDMPWDSIECGGITYCSLYGPDPGSGQIGADLGVFNGGGSSSVGSVGFWYYAQQDGTLYVTVQASVWGRGYVFSGLFGYASAYSALRVYIERYSTDFTVFQARTDIYNNWGVLEFDLRTFDWETRTVSIAIPVRRNTWYAIWADAVQNAYAGGVADSVSNFEMYVGPISYFLA